MIGYLWTHLIMYQIINARKITENQYQTYVQTEMEFNTCDLFVDDRCVFDCQVKDLLLSRSRRNRVTVVFAKEVDILTETQVLMALEND